MSTSGQVDYSKLSISKLAQEVCKDWKSVTQPAVPYLRAMLYVKELSDSYGHDSAASIVGYFLANASTWRGPIAREIKKELNERLKKHSQHR